MLAIRMIEMRQTLKGKRMWVSGGGRGFKLRCAGKFGWDGYGERDLQETEREDQEEANLLLFIDFEFSECRNWEEEDEKVGDDV